MYRRPEAVRGVVQAKAPGAASGIFFQAPKACTTPALAWMDMPLNRRAALAEKLPAMSFQPGTVYSLEDPVEPHEPSSGAAARTHPSVSA